MPGPLSMPRNWTEKERWNHVPGDHGFVGNNPIRRSGKTYWDHTHGKWESTRRNKADRAAGGKGKKGKKSGK